MVSPSVSANASTTPFLNPEMSSSNGKPSDQPFGSVYTLNLYDLLLNQGISLLVSTYQAGKLIIVRADPASGTVNTHFRLFQKPMGIAANAARLALGSERQVEEFYNMPAVAQKLQPPGKHDACYLPRNLFITGDVDIHEMAWINDELWFANTRFSCLCTLDLPHSFVPRWRPPFVSALTPEDRCHLNGLAPVEGRPKYVTMLGQTDTPQGWRENKAQGGLLMAVDTNEIISQGLSMPHSPRWYADRLWVLESGKGTLATVDLASGQVETVAEFPGFARGLDFYGPLAFIGLSQVRETAIFSGLPLTERLPEAERACGVWIVNIQTGQTLGFLKFTGSVQEIFAVQVLPGIRFPEVVDSDEELAPLIASSYALSDEALADVPGAIR